MNKLIKSQFIILLIGAVLSWASFYVKIISWNKNIPPLLSSDFIIALILTIAFIISWATTKKNKH